MVLVTWIDAMRSDDEATGLEQLSIKRETLGWLLRDDDAGVVIAMTHDEGKFERSFSIPRPYIEDVRRLKKRRKETFR